MRGLEGWYKGSLGERNGFANAISSFFAEHRLLANQPYPLHIFEQAQLANLLPQTAEEAKNYIPSLKNHWADADAELEALLNDLRSIAAIAAQDA